MDISMKDPLEQIFADKFAIMFTEVESVSLREEKREDLKTLLGPRYNDFFNIQKTIAPSKEFAYNYFMVRKSLDANQTETVKKVVETCRYTPAIKYPK
jgi:hypothetical protein